MAMVATTSELKFSVLVSFFDATKRVSGSAKKRATFRKFINTFCKPHDYFSAIRLILPSLDRARGSYGLKEQMLGTSIVDALGMSRDSEDAKKLIGWRRGGSKVAGDSAGNFSAVAAVEVLQRRQNSVSGGLTVSELNDLLDRLAAAEDRQGKSNVLGELIRKTNWQEMKWIIMIILKDLKLGISEKIIFNEFHPDAEDLFNVTCDLRFVCEKLCDRKVRHKRQDIEVGKAVRPQLALRVMSLAAAWKRFQGKEVVAECKFDGERIQIHKNGDVVRYFSRNFFSHTEYESGMNDVIVGNVLSERCILDGELTVWDKGSNCFASFGANQSVAKSMREGRLDGDRHLCYVVYDLLYVEDTSVIHQTLKERQELMRKFVRPVKGRLEVLLPSGEPCSSVIVKHVDEVERFFKEMVDNREEGVILKDLGSKWEPGDRGGKWIKLKPDYINAGSDLDVLIIGGYYGTGRRGGSVAQFLVGLAERSSPNTYPRRFMSFCKVGTGLKDEELDELVMKLKPYFRKYEYPKKSPPSFYQVTNNSKERPDVWVESPEKSIIVSITSDIRTIETDAFAAPYGLRFPRIDRVRYDKPWHECLDVQSFVELVQSSNGTIQRGGDNEGTEVGKPKRTRKGEGRKKLSLTVPSHFARTDVSGVKGESSVFSKMVFHFVNVPAGHSSGSLHTLVVENGGTFSMNLNDTVTHCIGAESKGIKYEAAKRRGRDVIHYSWFLDCCSKKQLLPLRPNHFINLSDTSRKKLQEEIDEFSDSYFWDINVAELKQILCDVNTSKDGKIIDYYKKKYCPRDKWCCFHGCRVYFHLVDKRPSSEWDVFLRVATRRMKVDVSVGGGKVVENPSDATHIVVVSLPGRDPDFDTLLQSFPEDKKRLLRLKRIHVVRCQWLEDCFEKGQKLPELVYNLKPDTMEESSSSDEECENDINKERLSASPVHEEPDPPKRSKTVAHVREPRRKRGRPAAVIKPLKPKRARVGKRPAKLQEVASDDEFSEQERPIQPRVSAELDQIKPQRPKRNSVRKRPAVLQEFESDDEFSDQEHHVQPRASRELGLKGKSAVKKTATTKRARGGKRAAKLLGISSDDENSEKDVRPESAMDGDVSPRSDPHEKSIMQEANTSEKYDSGTDSTVLGSKPVTLERNVEYKREEPKLRHDEIKHGLDNAEKSTELSTKLKSEETDDPAQAMLRNLIPSLGKTAQPPTPVSEDEDLPTKTPKEGSSSAPKGETVKKKKVSYKDLVNQFLKN
ncbi:DNA ligase 4 [Silene latifolia]|uniref:DNA ligase 4 n=1 Tax=Silene latifolia TaxID=37657 RepID=UPI003D7718B5